MEAPASLAESLALLMKDHVYQCVEDHSRYSKQIPLILFYPEENLLECKVCHARETLLHRIQDIRPGDDFLPDMEKHICSMMTQQQRFFDNHFLTCVFPGDVKQ